MSRFASPPAAAPAVRCTGTASDVSETPAGLVSRIASAIPWILAVYVALMFVATHMPAAHIPKSLPGSDKHWHFLAYFGLGAILSVWGRSRPSNWPWIALAIAAVYGIVDELLQIPVGRTADIEDWIADIAGAGSGVALVAIISAIGVRTGMRWTRAS